jgi:hypothetical protein
MLRYIPSFSSFLRKLEWVVLDLVKGFFCIYWDDQVVFVFTSINVLYYIYRFVLLKHPCIPGMKLSCSWWMIFLMCCWIWFAFMLLMIFALIFIKEIGI